MHKIKGRLIIISIIILSKISTVQAQAPLDSFRLLNELLKIESSYLTADHLSFDFTYILSNRDSGVTTTDSLTGTFKMNGENMYLFMDSVELIQNEHYRLTVYHHDKIMQVESPTSVTENLFKINPFDSYFNNNGYGIFDAGAIRTMNLYFTGDSPFMSYYIKYDTTSSRLTEVKYAIKKGIYPRPVHGPTDNFQILTLQFSNYTTGTYSDTAFNTNAFIKPQNGSFSPQSAFSDFEVINATRQQ